MKKLIATILCIALVFAIVSTGFAASDAVDVNTKIIKMTIDGDYAEVQASASKTKNDAIKITPAKHDGFFMSDGGVYYAKSGNGKYYEVDRVEISLMNPKALKDVITQYDLNPQMTEVLENAFANLDKEKAVDAIATLYLSSTQNASGVVERYYTYNGFSLRDDTIALDNYYTQYQTIKTGSTAHNVAATLVAITVEGLSYVPFVNFLSSGVNLLSNFQSIWGTPTVWGSGDYLQVRYNYNKVSKWTYVKLGTEWPLGAYTNQATMAL